MSVMSDDTAKDEVQNDGETTAMDEGVDPSVKDSNCDNQDLPAGSNGSSDDPESEVQQPNTKEDENNTEEDKMVEENSEPSPPDEPPDYATQKEEMKPHLQQKLKQGDEWYLIDQRWFKQWKKYTGYDSWDQHHAGSESVMPGPVDNSNLLEDPANNIIKDHLMEELDYTLLPKPAWEKFVLWYSITPQSQPICRRVVEYGTYVKHLKVEVYLITVKVCVHPHINDTKQILLSRADTIKIVQDKLRKLFEILDDSETRLWQRYMTNSYELMKDPDQSLADSGIYGGQILMLEMKNKEGKWTRDSSSTSSYGSSAGSHSVSSYSASSGVGSSSHTSSSYWKQDPTTPGLCGLSNLGNTCFMNSALQCLSNTKSLTEYFMGEEGMGEKPYRKHINKDNPLGMKGALAETYGDLLDMMWSGDNSYLAPRQFKMMIGKHAPQFSGYQQHDSHELLAFLLDGLHEDLNLVRKKPYVDMDIKTEGRQDKEIAAEAWHKYLLRNQSVIVRLFQGQLKSKLNCPKCRKISRIFDPFMYTSLPLPIQKTRSVFVYLVSASPFKEIVRYRLVVPKGGSILELKQAMQKVTDIDPKNLVVIDVYHSRFHRVYYDKDAISQIMDRDDIYLYELAKPLGDDSWVPIPVYMREIRVQKSYSYYSSKTTETTYGQVFGLPIVVTIPREGCTYRQLYNIILVQCQRYVTEPTVNPKKAKIVDVTEEKATAENNSSSKDEVEEMDVQQVREPEPGNNEDENGRGTAEDSQETAGEPMDTDEDHPPNTSSNGGDTKASGGEDDNEEEKKDSSDEGNGGSKEEKEEQEEEEGQNENQNGEENGNETKEVNKDSNNNDLFKLIVVNAYGSQEVQKLHDTNKKLKLTSQTYVSCDWMIETKEKYYDVKKAEEFVDDSSCDEKMEKKKSIDIYDCLDLFAQEEQLGEEDAWYCPHCKEFVQAFKKFDIWKLPEVLVIHLKRFSYSRWWRNKIESKVHFPLTGLDLSKYVVNEEQDKPIYDLFAVSNHFGGLGGGHYTAYCKNKVTGKWYSFDDSHVSETDESSVCSSSSYVLFYARQTEGRGARRGVDRSLSSSFDEEVRQLNTKKSQSGSTAMDTNCIEEEDEGGETAAADQEDSVYEDASDGGSPV